MTLKYLAILYSLFTFNGVTLKGEQNLYCHLQGLCRGFLGVIDRESVIRLKMSQIVECDIFGLDCFFSCPLWTADAWLLGSPPGCRESGGGDEGQLLQVQVKASLCLWMAVSTLLWPDGLDLCPALCVSLRCPGRSCGPRAPSVLLPRHSASSASVPPAVSGGRPAISWFLGTRDNRGECQSAGSNSDGLSF